MTAQKNAINDHLLKGIKGTYAQESGIDVDDPEFWAKLSKWKASLPDPPEREPEICPSCGQEIY